MNLPVELYPTFHDYVLQGRTHAKARGQWAYHGSYGGRQFGKTFAQSQTLKRLYGDKLHENSILLGHNKLFPEIKVLSDKLFSHKDEIK